MPRTKHPNQPLVIDKQGVTRFKRNAIVSWLLDISTARGVGMNEIAIQDFPREDRVQFAQLIGYSLCGFGELSYVKDSDWKRIQNEQDQVTKSNQKGDSSTDR